MFKLLQIHDKNVTSKIKFIFRSAYQNGALFGQIRLDEVRLGYVCVGWG